MVEWRYTATLRIDLAEYIAKLIHEKPNPLKRLGARESYVRKQQENRDCQMMYNSHYLDHKTA
jgi:hypothetical protein